MLSTGFCAQLACIWEVTAAKPGNVNRYFDFEKTTLVDFLVSAASIAPLMESACGRRVGDVVLDGVRATRQLVQSNTNLGILLLLAPLATIPRNESLRQGLPRVMRQLNVEDARRVYEAIGLAEPGGMSRVAEQDIHAEPTVGLREVMKLAAERDLIARQYINDFQDIFEIGVPALASQLQAGETLETAILFCFLKFMATYPDSLIVRKCGHEFAEEIRVRVAGILGSGWPAPENSDWYLDEIQDLDQTLRAEGNKRNPGTSADLVTASLFVALRDGAIDVRHAPWMKD
jgi:triphosphoribosyl-dephospho-CoA synthase